MNPKANLPACSRPYVPPYQYACTGGAHQLASDRPLDRCPLWVCGQQCTGTLRRVGPGSRTEAHRAA